MKRALRNTETAMFIKSDGGETELIEDARAFQDYKEAFTFCSDHQLQHVELVVRTPERYEFTVAVPQDSGNP